MEQTWGASASSPKQSFRPSRWRADLDPWQTLDLLFDLTVCRDSRRSRHARHFKRLRNSIHLGGCLLSWGNARAVNDSTARTSWAAMCLYLCVKSSFFLGIF